MEKKKQPKKKSWWLDEDEVEDEDEGATPKTPEQDEVAAPQQQQSALTPAAITEALQQFFAGVPTARVAQDSHQAPVPPPAQSVVKPPVAVAQAGPSSAQQVGGGIQQGEAAAPQQQQSALTPAAFTDALQQFFGVPTARVAQGSHQVPVPPPAQSVVKPPGPSNQRQSYSEAARSRPYLTPADIMSRAKTWEREHSKDQFNVKKHFWMRDNILRDIKDVILTEEEKNEVALLLQPLFRIQDMVKRS